MNNVMFGDIAAKLGVSCATVSRAVRHCSSVDSDTRLKILREARKMNIQPSGYCDIYCILPDTPQYFWGEIRRGLCENHTRDIKMKLNIVTCSYDEETVLMYLDEAAEFGASAVIIAAIITDRIAEKLKKMIPHTFVVLLSEYRGITNSFYIGANPYADGYALGELYVQNYSDRKTLLLSREDRNMYLRLEGFKKALHDCGCRNNYKEIAVEKGNVGYRTSASILAKIISPYAAETDCIYSPFGNAVLPLAVKKAGFSDNTVLLCHDTFISGTDYDIIEDFDAVINQDVYAQGKAAINAAEDFVRTRCCPFMKFTYIPSVIRRITH